MFLIGKKCGANCRRMLLTFSWAVRYEESTPMRPLSFHRMDRLAIGWNDKGLIGVLSSYLTAQEKVRIIRRQFAPHFFPMRNMRMRGANSHRKHIHNQDF